MTLFRRISRLEKSATFRAWFAAFDAESWDRQIADYIEGGKHDAPADAALADHRAGRTTPL